MKTMAGKGFALSTLAVFLAFASGCDDSKTVDSVSEPKQPTVSVGPPVSLFDGATLEGWEGKETMFRVEGGAIVGGNLGTPIPNNEFLCTTAEYGDFELSLKVKAIGEGVNAGIQFRSQRVPDNHEVSGYQADVGKGWWGKLYDESRRNKTLVGHKLNEDELVKSEDWNDYQIRCEGARIQLWINGTLTVDYTEEDDSIPRSGLIGLQIHGGPPSEAWYKDIVIRELR